MENGKNRRKVKWKWQWSFLSGIILALSIAAIGIYVFKSEADVFLIGVLFGVFVGAMLYHIDLVRIGRIRE